MIVYAVHPPSAGVALYHQLSVGVLAAANKACSQAVTGPAHAVIFLPGAVQAGVFGATVVTHGTPGEQGGESEHGTLTTKGQNK